MAFLNRDQVKGVVIKSLQTVSDIPDDVEAATFTNMNAIQQHMFLSSLKANLNALPYYMNDGTTSNLAYYDVDLTPDSTGQWATVGDCIDWIVANQSVVYLS